MRSSTVVGRMIIVVVLTGGSASRLTEEGEVGRTSHVRRREEGSAQTDDHEGLIAVVAHVVDDLVLGEETGQWEHAGEGQRGDDPGGRRDRHLLGESTHVLLHVEGVMRARMADRAGGEEETRLEERVGEDVEHGRQPGARTEAEHHVAELRDRRVGQHLLDVVLHEREQRCDDDRDSTDQCDEVDVGVGDLQTFPEHRVDTRHEEHSGHDHRARVEQRTHRGGAGHGIGQPRVQRELTRLSDACDEESDRSPRERALTGVTGHRPGR